MPEQQQLGCLEVGRCGSVSARRDAVDGIHDDPAPAASSSSSRVVKQVVQRSNSRSSPAGSRTVARSWSTPVATSNVSSPSRKRTAKAAENAETARLASLAQRSHDPVEHVHLVAAAEEAEPSLAEADRGIELRLIRQRADVEQLEVRVEPVGCGLLTRQREELVGCVDADDLDPPSSKLERVPPRPAPNVEHSLTGLQLERIPEEVDLLHCPLRERVAQVCRPEKPSDRSEPVVTGCRHRISR